MWVPQTHLVIVQEGQASPAEAALHAQRTTWRAPQHALQHWVRPWRAPVTCPLEDGALRIMHS